MYIGRRILFGQKDLPVNLTQARVRAAYNLRRGTFRVTRLHNSIRLSDMKTILVLGDRTFSSADKSCRNSVVVHDALRFVVRSEIREGPAWETRFEIRTHPNEGRPILDRALRDAYGLAVSCKLEGGSAGAGGEARFALVGKVVGGRSAFSCRLAPPAGSTPLQVASGDVASGLNTSFYDPRGDCAVHLGAQHVAIGAARNRGAWKSFPVRLEFRSTAGIDFVERFYETVHGFRHFPEIRSRRFRPLAGWTDWYMTWGRSDEATVLRQVDWIAENLRDYGVEVIQIDDGWQSAYRERPAGPVGLRNTDWFHPNERFAGGMDRLAERIRAKGFKAGIWLVPYATNDAALLREHPDWFLRDADGKPIPAAGGWARQFGYMLDFSNRRVRRKYLVPLFKMLSRRWGYDYFKLDATGWALLAVKDKKFGPEGRPGVEVLRRGLETIRDVVGDKFVLACHAPCREVVGLVDGARVAGDMSPGWKGGPLHLLRETMESFYTHRICWLNDPDCLVIGPPLTLEQARLFASMFGLTGQHLILSGALDRLDGDRVEILRRVLPVCPTRPLDLYARKDRAAIWDLKIKRRFGRWDVVGVFNFDERASTKIVRFADLGLAEGVSYVLYDFWNKKCYGRVEDEFAVRLPPTSCRVFAVHRFLGRPQLVSTSRHITQGGVDLVSLKWNEHRRELVGRSRVVGGDPYLLSIWVPEGWKAEEAESSAAETRLEAAPAAHVAQVRIATDRTREVDWRVRFSR